MLPGISDSTGSTDLWVSCSGHHCFRTKFFLESNLTLPAPWRSHSLWTDHHESPLLILFVSEKVSDLNTTAVPSPSGPDRKEPGELITNQPPRGPKPSLVAQQDREENVTGASPSARS